MELPSFTEGTAFICGMIGFAGLAEAPYTGEGLIGSVCLLAVCGLLAICSKIGKKNKRK